MGETGDSVPFLPGPLDFGADLFHNPSKVATNRAAGAGGPVNVLPVPTVKIATGWILWKSGRLTSPLG